MPDDPIFRYQKIGVLRRNGRYWAGSTAWVDRIELAKVIPVNQLRDKARIDVGMPCEIVHVLPVENPATMPEIVGEDADRTFVPKRPAERIRRRR
jgi:hypothetical protein